MPVGRGKTASVAAHTCFLGFTGEFGRRAPFSVAPHCSRWRQLRILRCEPIQAGTSKLEEACIGDKPYHFILSFDNSAFHRLDGLNAILAAEDALKAPWPRESTHRLHLLRDNRAVRDLMAEACA